MTAIEPTYQRRVCSFCHGVNEHERVGILWRCANCCNENEDTNDLVPRKPVATDPVQRRAQARAEAATWGVLELASWAVEPRPRIDWGDAGKVPEPTSGWSVSKPNGTPPPFPAVEVERAVDVRGAAWEVLVALNFVTLPPEPYLDALRGAVESLRKAFANEIGNPGGRVVVAGDVLPAEPAPPPTAAEGEGALTAASVMLAVRFFKARGSWQLSAEEAAALIDRYAAQRCKTVANAHLKQRETQLVESDKVLAARDAELVKARADLADVRKAETELHEQLYQAETQRNDWQRRYDSVWLALSPEMRAAVSAPPDSGAGMAPPAGECPRHGCAKSACEEVAELERVIREHNATISRVCDERDHLSKEHDQRVRERGELREARDAAVGRENRLIGQLEAAEQHVKILQDQLELSRLNHVGACTERDAARAELAAWLEPGEPSEPTTLAQDVASALNRHSAENGSNTPDFILAEYLLGCLAAWNAAAKERERWYGRAERPCSAPTALGAGPREGEG